MMEMGIRALALLASLAIAGAAGAAESETEIARPLGIELGKTDYAVARAMLDARGWPSQEFERKHFKRIEPDDPERGRNTFVKATPKGLVGAKSMEIFFGADRRVEAVILALERAYFEIAMDVLNEKYRLVEQKLEGQPFSTSYPHVLYEAGGTLVELQRYSPNHVRIVYVTRLQYENYRDFLYDAVEPGRPTPARPDWMDEL